MPRASLGESGLPRSLAFLLATALHLSAYVLLLGKPATPQQSRGGGEFEGVGQRDERRLGLLVSLGRPEDVAAKINDFYDAGLRHVVMDFVGPYEERDVQIERFAKEVRPLLSVAS